jgi:hypothetical protein
MEKTNTEILTPEVIAAYRLPVDISQLSAICQMAPKNSQMEHRGEWIVVLDPARMEVVP